MKSRNAVLAAALLAAAALGASPAGEAAKQLVVPRNSVGTLQIKNRSILPVDLSQQTIRYLTAGAPAPKARGVTVAAGTHGDRVRIHAPNLTGGNVLGQIEYLGGLECATLGPWAKAEATFFDADGVVVATGSDTNTSSAAGVRYPLEIFGARGAVRAELVASVECI
jgi:hypothetical protein